MADLDIEALERQLNKLKEKKLEVGTARASIFLSLACAVPCQALFAPDRCKEEARRFWYA